MVGFPGFPKFSAKFLHRFCGLKCRNRNKPCLLMSFCICFSNDIISVFITSASSFLRVRIQIPMQLQNQIGAGNNVFITFVNGSKHFTITCNFLLRTVSGFRLLAYQFLQSLIRCIDAFDTVGSSRTLNQCNFQKGFQFVNIGFQK